MIAQPIPLTTLQDILDVESDADFEQIVLELSDSLRSLRQRTKMPGHGGIVWPIRWRRDSAPSTITTHCTDGTTLPQPMKLVETRRV